MTNTVDSLPRVNIADFKPKHHLAAEVQLNAFIEWAKDTLPKGIPNRVYASIRWEDESWHAHGFHNCAFTAINSSPAAPVKMKFPFTDFAKAIVVYRRIYQGMNSVADWHIALKALEAALVELTGTRDVTRVSATVCNLASERIRNRWSNAYIYSKSLEQIIALMQDKKLLKTEFRWTSPLKNKPRGTLKQQKADREQKLPNPEAVKALGEIFNNDLSGSLDIVVTSACALLLCAPSRIGELANVEHDCVVFKEDVRGNQRMFLRWYAEKINRPILKPVVKPEMESVVERAITLLKPVTDDGRAYAAWLEDHPDQFPSHEGLPQKGADDPLNYVEVCAALAIAVSRPSNARSSFKNIFLVPFEKSAKKVAIGPAAQAILDEIREGWDTDRGKPIFVKGKPGVHRIEFNDRFVITLSKLNILVREKYLPKHFPYTTPYTEGQARLKYRDALFTVRTGTLRDETKKAAAMRKTFGVEIAASQSRISAQLAGRLSGRITSIFERYGYLGLKVNTHAFRHELNTEMQRAGLSQLLIDAFSGRTSMGSVYNHTTIEERTQGVAAYHPKTKHNNAAQRLEKVKSNQPLSLSDVRILHEGDQDRIIHQTHVGICVHNFAAEPCPKIGACLTCGKLGCVKGDDVKLANLKEEREDLKRRYDKAIDAQSRDIFGASEWAEKVGVDLYKCDALIRILENPELENGDIVWNVDNGWTLANNAAAMAGLIDAKVIEEKNEQPSLPSLDELSAMLDEIEV